ncbi:hypothetical protein B7463_g3324, partial [Scytalidium lignicola]
MKFTYAAAAVMAFAGLASAQIPACAQPCLDAATKSATKCGATDIVCQCQPSNQAAIQGAATTCVVSSCGDQALSVLSAAQAACKAALAAPATTAAASSAPASSAPAATSSAPATKSAAASTVSSSSAAASTTLATSTAASSIVAAPTTNTTTNGTAPSAAPTPFKPNGAGQLGASLGGAFVMAVIALVAF